MLLIHKFRLKIKNKYPMKIVINKSHPKFISFFIYVKNLIVIGTFCHYILNFTIYTIGKAVFFS